jgi:hypothetical protein
MTLWPGSTVRVSGEFLNKDKLEGIDPGNVTLRVLRPDGIPYVGAIIEHDGPGHHHADILIDQSGRRSETKASSRPRRARSCSDDAPRHRPFFGAASYHA